MGAGGSYAFRGIDDVYDAVHAPLADAGIVTLPEIVRIDRSERPRDNRPPQVVVSMRMRVHFYGPRGDSVWSEAEAEAHDFGDKATPKASSVAFRTAVIQTFTIPLRDSASHIDSEVDNDDRISAEQGPAKLSTSKAKLDLLEILSADVLETESRRTLAAEIWSETFAGSPPGDELTDAQWATLIDLAQARLNALGSKEES